jgi:hypothetical protein
VAITACTDTGVDDGGKKFASSINNTGGPGGKFATSVIDTGGALELRISPRILDKI